MDIFGNVKDVSNVNINEEQLQLLKSLDGVVMKEELDRYKRENYYAHQTFMSREAFKFEINKVFTSNYRSWVNFTNKRIVNVAEGVDQQDAVTLGQLEKAMDTLVKQEDFQTLKKEANMLIMQKETISMVCRLRSKNVKEPVFKIFNLSNGYKFLYSGKIMHIELNPDKYFLNISLNDTLIETFPFSFNKDDIITFKPTVNAAMEEGQLLFVVMYVERQLDEPREENEDASVRDDILGSSDG